MFVKYRDLAYFSGDLGKIGDNFGERQFPNFDRRSLPVASENGDWEDVGACLMLLIGEVDCFSLKNFFPFFHSASYNLRESLSTFNLPTSRFNSMGLSRMIRNKFIN